MQFLVITLKAPMMAFPGPVIDGIGNTGRLPRLSAVSGLIANALGYERHEAERQEALQDQIIFAAREDVAGEEMMDFQTARLSNDDKHWTRFGVEGRDGSAATYDSPILRRRPYLSDHTATLVVGLKEGDLQIEDIKAALEKPARPLFLGRKAFLPSGPLLDRSRDILVEADDVLTALKAVPAFNGQAGSMRACWPSGLEDGNEVNVDDIRNFRLNRHSGARKQMEGRISVAA